MLKKALIFLLCGVFLLAGCDEEPGEPEISVTDITPKNGYHYALAEDCGNGCFYNSDGIMWYYDYKHKTSVPFCSDPACRHEDKACAAYLPGRVFGYKDKFVIAENEHDREAEGFVNDESIVIKTFDINSQTIHEAISLKGREWCDTYAYGDRLFIGLGEEYYLDGDYIFAGSDRVRVYFMVVSLDTLEVEFVSDCLLDAFQTEIYFMGGNGGRIFFDIRYNETRFEDSDLEDPFDLETFHKYMEYDIETKEFSECTRQEHYFDGCAVYFDGRNISFDCGEKICQLKSDYDLPYFPLNLKQFCNGKVYFKATFAGNCTDTFFIFDTETERPVSISCAGLDKMKFVAERENEFIFSTADSSLEKGNGDEIVVLPKDDLIFTEVTPERYNELCKSMQEYYQNSETERN